MYFETKPEGRGSDPAETIPTERSHLRRPTMGQGEWMAVVALASLLAITVGWWALALWPVPGVTPEWLERARAVCFNATGTGLPDASGWLLLIGQPIGMFAVLMVGWGEGVRGGLRGLAASLSGRMALAGAGLVVAGGLGAAGVRVAEAAQRERFELAGGELAAADLPRMDWRAPELGLVDQDGEVVSTGDFAGQPFLVTFAFGHCETVCPVVVEGAMEGRRRFLGGEGQRPAHPPPTLPRVSTPGEHGNGWMSPIPLIVVTLDPWRDTPSRLPHLASRWSLEPGDRVLSGSVGEVQTVLEAWKVGRERDLTTGDIIHPALVYLVDPDGRIAFGTGGLPKVVAELLERL